ncbi:MAG: HAMP domain-containing histidine kinase [Cyanobacteria bacterium SZAS-4]|nr:HAMP domain-containing histidine kinase [Cyanobacteria bacterium SZAS-4]
MRDDKSRTRIAFWFIGLSSLAYITPTILGVFFFYGTLTAALDQELRTLASSIGHAIDLSSGQPRFRDWARVVHTEPARALYAIQLFNLQGTLLESYGIKGSRLLSPKVKELNDQGQQVRLLVTNLDYQGKIIGYLQLEVSTKERDAATKSFIWTMLMIAPFVIAGLSFCGYYVSDKATIPIRKAVVGLRQFLADAGHELNTPLSVVSAYTESLQKKLDKAGLSFDEPAIITNAADRMKKIIDDLSLLAEIESLEKESTYVDLEDIVKQQATEFSIRFQEKNLQFVCRTIPECKIQGNAQALHFLISNLLANALRYTNHGSVEIALQRDGAAVKVVVSDTGIGIPENAQEDIFKRFYRVDKSRSRTSGGSGLGLAIVKAITEAHGGAIEVISVLDKGSQFTVTLPTDGFAGERPQTQPRAQV